ncbi:MAG: HAD family hydrolase [Actinomycetales bacterium]|nr:MAG: HAD family hydrolase [Actinomycetales bacterium]
MTVTTYVRATTPDLLGSCGDLTSRRPVGPRRHHRRHRAAVDGRRDRPGGPARGHLDRGGRPRPRALPFDAVVTGDEVSRGKPHPEPYLAAARMLGVDPADCLAVEDSATGAASADAAGCVVLVVPHMVTVPDGPRRLVRPSLAGLDVSMLRELWATA